MIFSIILLLQEHLHAGAVAAAAGGIIPDNIGEILLSERLSLTAAPVLLGFLCGGAVIFWFCGASIQAVTTGAYSAVEYIKKNLDLSQKEARREDSITVVRICTEYAQKGMWNIFLGLLSLTLAFALFDPYFFIAYLIAIAVFGLFQAMYMANAGGAWDNAKKLVEVDFGEKNTPVHAATVVGDTVGDPFKDTTSVSLNPIIKFSTLFGMLAVEIAIKMNPAMTRIGAVLFFLSGLYFVWRSFYRMRIPAKVKGLSWKEFTHERV
jgi:K(+)-stimulated pyrophosphate-energized sodium pump